MTTPEDWAGDLLRAGWHEVRLSVWADPAGALYRGPFGAWRRMKAAQRAAARQEKPEPPRCPRCGCYEWIYKGDRQVCADCGY